ncbi:MAG: hypothetical protein BWK76_09595 [Desulfobulbaceae bacterium A2]|nr:MAG: hypothetical protein BWK76_09595 [Desulfobulbaceae bacterium A2]
MHRCFVLGSCILATLLLSSCGGMEPVRRYSGPAFAPVRQTKIAFQTREIPASCQVIAHVVHTSPPGAGAQDIARALVGEASSRGADLLLVGLSREVKKGASPGVSYYGPEVPYRFTDAWAGWKFGLDERVTLGGWATLGAAEWGAASVRYDTSIRTKVAFLRCQ